MAMVKEPPKDQETRPIAPAVLELKRLVEAHLAVRKLREVWLYTRMGMSKGSYYDMWRRGSVRVDVLAEIADALGITMLQLLTDPAVSDDAILAMEPPATYGPRPRFIEERLADLERELQQLKKTLRK